MAFDMFLVIPRVADDPPVTETPTLNRVLATAFRNSAIISVASVEFGVSNSSAAVAASSGAESGKVQLSSLKVQRNVDLASPSLFSACASGRRFENVQLYFRHVGSGSTERTFLACEFVRAFITNIDWYAAASADQPAETLILEYAALVIAYKSANSDGSAGPVSRASWDQSANTAAVPGEMALVWQ